MQENNFKNHATFLHNFWQELTMQDCLKPNLWVLKWLTVLGESVSVNEKEKVWIWGMMTNWDALHGRDFWWFPRTNNPLCTEAAVYLMLDIAGSLINMLPLKTALKVENHVISNIAN